MKRPLVRCLAFITGLSGALLLTACGADDVDSLYANIRAYYRFNAVTAATPLYTAVNNPGQFCTITFSGKSGAYTYTFTSPDGQTATYPETAVSGYTPPECICGFVVGTSAIPDLSTGESLVAYDLVCPNCYEDNVLNLRLSFTGTRQLKCASSRGCGRVYDLDNSGCVSSGESGRALFRYHVAYSSTNNTLLIQN